jgi:two-component system, OmpR family, response regulator
MSKVHHILLVEDDREIARLVAGFLDRSGFRVTHVPDGKPIADVLAKDRPDLVLLDVLLPGEDGLSIARRIRTACQVPIIMLTAMGEERDRIRGLDLGADDYVTKPFSSRELVSRINAVLRRSSGQGDARHGEVAQFAFAGWTLNVRSRELFDPFGVRVDLTTAEFEMLRTFCIRPGTILGRDELARMAQGRRVEPYDRSIDTQISRLRAKIDMDETAPSHIKTVRNSGYVFTPSVVATLE